MVQVNLGCDVDADRDGLDRLAAAGGGPLRDAQQALHVRQEQPHGGQRQQAEREQHRER